MKVSFKLGMPNVGSWNGKWSGANREYYLIKTLPKQSEEAKRVLSLLGEKKRVGFYYNFGDGWGASVSMEVVDAREAKRRQKVSAGFNTYHWMVDEILEHGKIFKRDERV